VIPVKEYKEYKADKTLVGAGCGELPCGCAESAHGGNVYISVWQLSWRERLSVLFRGVVALWVWGQTHPPVAVETYNGGKFSKDEEVPK